MILKMAFNSNQKRKTNDNTVSNIDEDFESGSRESKRKRRDSPESRRNASENVTQHSVSDIVSDMSELRQSFQAEEDPSLSDTSSTTNSSFDASDLNRSATDLSTVTDISSVLPRESRWLNMTDVTSFVNEHISRGTDPMRIIRHLLPGVYIPSDANPTVLWRIVIEILSEPNPRHRLKDVYSLSHVLALIKDSHKILVVTGAGISVSCGIPDFRSRNGIYARLSKEYPDLPDPQAMFDIQYFKKNQKPFFKFAKEIYPGQFTPSISHRFIRLLEVQGQLLRNYTQNIDTLETVAGINRVVHCHGSFSTASCMKCKHKVSHDTIEEDIMMQQVPHCPVCPADVTGAIMKPDIVFFGESLSEEFHDQIEADRGECDLVIVMGSSMKVRPVALIPHSVGNHVPQILINRERLRNLSFDIQLLGDCDLIVSEICRHLGWTEIAQGPSQYNEVTESIFLSHISGTTIAPHHHHHHEHHPSRAPAGDEAIPSQVAEAVMEAKLHQPCQESSDGKTKWYTTTTGRHAGANLQASRTGCVSADTFDPSTADTEDELARQQLLRELHEQGEEDDPNAAATRDGGFTQEKHSAEELSPDDQPVRDDISLDPVEQTSNQLNAEASSVDLNGCQSAREGISMEETNPTASTSTTNSANSTNLLLGHVKVTDYLEAGHYLFKRPNLHIFPGSEYVLDIDNLSSSDSSSNDESDDSETDISSESDDGDNDEEEPCEISQEQHETEDVVDIV